MLSTEIFVGMLVLAIVVVGITMFIDTIFN